MSIDRLGKKSPRSPEQIDYGWVKAFLSKEIARFVAAIRVPKDGEPGKDADPEAIARAVHDAVSAVPVPVAKAGEPGPRGPKGPKGDDGEMGPMPAHRWEGTELQFERPDGSWGKRVDLQGPRGYPGASGGVLVQGGTGNSYSPGGW